MNPSALRKYFPFIVAFAVLCISGIANAQLSTSLKLSKRQFVMGEPVLATITVTNYSGSELTFYSDARTQWLNFIMKDGRGNFVTGRPKTTFGKMKIRAGETLAREVDLSQHFSLNTQGGYSVGAVVNMPKKADGSVESSSTNRIQFNISSGIPYWTQKVGIPKTGKTREFRVLNFNGGDKSHLYAQINDVKSGQNVRTFRLGDVLMLRKPLVTVDRQQTMHVMFLATPTMWVHCQVDADGKLANRQIHQRGDLGDPQLVTFPDGSVRVANSIPYDANAVKEAAGKVRKASDRPGVNY
jgi:hypothetical protein